MLYALGQVDSFQGTGVWSFIKVNRTSEEKEADATKEASKGKKN